MVIFIDSVEFLWAMADGDGKVQEEETPNIIRGVSRDDLANVVSPKSGEAVLRRGASEPAMMVNDDIALR